MKRIITVLLALVLALSLFACAQGGQNQPGKTDNTTVPSGTASGDNTGNTGNTGDTHSGEEPTAPQDGDPNEGKEPVVGSEGFKVEEYDDSCTITDIGTFSGTEMIVPSHINGKPVRRIDEDALSNDTMTSLFIPWTVVSIGEDAFSTSKNLETVTFSEGLKSVGEGSFGDCTSIKTVTLPASLESVYYSGFAGCTALEEVTLLGNASLGKYAFSRDTALEKVTFADDSGRAYSVGSSAFEFDAALRSAVLSEGLTTIGSFAFAGCTSLGTVTLPKSLENIEASAFSQVGALKIIYAGSEEDWGRINVAGGNEALAGAEITFNAK